jgi:hypothetical protein
LGAQADTRGIRVTTDSNLTILKKVRIKNPIINIMGAPLARQAQ